jgi:hypothetical protein
MTSNVRSRPEERRHVMRRSVIVAVGALVSGVAVLAVAAAPVPGAWQQWQRSTFARVRSAVRWLA